MFIKLTNLRLHTGETSPIFVNPAHITYLYFETQAKRIFKPEHKGVGVEATLTYTIISFVAGLREESDAINVTETPEEIIAQIP